MLYGSITFWFKHTLLQLQKFMHFLNLTYWKCLNEKRKKKTGKKLVLGKIPRL